MLLNLPDDASNEDALRALSLIALREDPRVSKAAKRVKIDRKTLSALLKKWDMVLAWVPKKVLEAHYAAESGTISPPSTLNHSSPPPSTLNPQPSTLAKSDLLDPETRAKMEALKARRGNQKK